MSCQDFSQQEYQEYLKAAFARFLRSNYPNYTVVAAAYQVREQTALNWWNGLHMPNGIAVCRAFQERPASAAEHLTLVVDNTAAARPAGRRTGVRAA